MSDRGIRESSARRSSYRKSLSETTLPPQYLAQLEEKRKQLDESIHKYIAAKEREYKAFEKELRQQHRLGNGGDATNGTSKRRGSAESSQGDNHTTGLEAQRISAADSLEGPTPRRDQGDRAVEVDDDVPALHDRSTIAGLKDRRASLEREKDFIGVFTPSFLPALDYRDSSKLERTSSAPSAVQQTSNAEILDDSGALERAQSDSAMQAKPKRPSQLALVQRTSSSGSSADGKLASAMKNAQRPKRKQRVSLAVGDAIVAPSDSVPLSLSQHSSSSHSRVRAAARERELSTFKKQSSNGLVERSASFDSSLQIAQDVALANAVGDDQAMSERVSAAAIATSPKSSSSYRTRRSASKVDADGDLFDLEDEDEDEMATRDPTYDEESIGDSEDPALESGGEIIGRVNDTVSEGFEVDPGEEKYDPTTGLVPEPPDGTDSAVPYLAFGPTSPIASQQPTQPGFRRPSVVYDPIYRGSNYQAAERDAVENDVYGSSFNRPSSKGSFTAGSLGESYMAKHAEMMKQRLSKQQAQVRS